MAEGSAVCHARAVHETVGSNVHVVAAVKRECAFRLSTSQENAVRGTQTLGNPLERTARDDLPHADSGTRFVMRELADCTGTQQVAEAVEHT